MPKDPKQSQLFDNPPAWTEHWTGMPEFKQRDERSYQSVTVHFANAADRDAFAGLIDQKITERTHYIWFPAKTGKRSLSPKLNGSGAPASNPRYPVYVISKGRWKLRSTVRGLTRMQVPFRVVIEPTEYQEYAAVIDPDNILTLPFSDLGEGSIPARNWIWEHSIREGHARHWIIDDNIGIFYRLNNNVKYVVNDGSIFRAAEEFVDRYENVALAGFQYEFFVKRKEPTNTPILLNTRIYSCILIDNSLPHRWRGRYNEDTDLSLRVLKDGLCTVLFQAFLAKKETTMRLPGGNSDILYTEDGRRKMAESLVEQHPDVVSIAWKFKRWQHKVNYKPFKRNQLKLKPGVVIDASINNYGMILPEEPSQ